MNPWTLTATWFAVHPDMAALFGLFLPLGASLLNGLGHLAVKRWPKLQKAHDVLITLFPDPAGLVVKLVAGKLGLRTVEPSTSTPQGGEKRDPS